MFLLGACGLAYEYTLSKIAADLLGNSVQQWATMIATMLFAMGLGAEWQSKIATEKMVDRLVVSQVVLAFVGGFAPPWAVDNNGKKVPKNRYNIYKDRWQKSKV